MNKKITVTIDHPYSPSLEIKGDKDLLKSYD